MVLPPTVLGSELVVLGLTVAKEDTLMEALIVTLLLSLFPGCINGTLFLKSACHAAGVCCILFCIIVVCLETIKVLLGMINFALCLFQLHLVHGELCTNGGSISIYLGTGTDGGVGTDEAFCDVAFGICGMLMMFSS